MNEFADHLLLGIENRGKHATGFVATTFDGKVVLDKAAVPASEFVVSRERIPRNAQAILLHTRWQTKGDAENSVNNHPVIYNTCFAIHNGSINNDDELFAKHELKRNGEVDTEIIPAILNKFGMDTAEHIKQALTELRGTMAIAAIDPVKNPGQLLLARGENSPLNIYHTENYIVWASTSMAIREAWGKVFGTPPEWGKIGSLSEGKFWVANGKDVKETGFEIPRPLWFRGNQQQPARRPTRITNRRSGSNTGTNGRKLPWVGADSLFITEKFFLDTVAEFRKSWQGRDRVRVWSHRDEYDDKTDFEDVDGLMSWLPCVCGEAVLAEDTKFHMKYGTICLDCYDVITKKYREKVDGRPDFDDQEEKPVVKVYTLTEKDQDTLDDWANVDMQMNVLCINEIAKLTGLPYTTIEYLMWRMEERASDSDYSKGLRKLQADIKQLYKAVETEMWTAHGDRLLGTLDDSHDEDDQHIAYTVNKGGGVSEVWYKCILHQEDFRAGDECSRCSSSNKGRGILRYTCMDCGDEFPRYQVKYVDTKGTTDSSYICEECEAWTEHLAWQSNGSDGDGGADSCGVSFASPALENVVRCGECSAFKQRDKACRVCEAKQGEAETKALSERTTKSCYCNTTKGAPCKRKVKFIAGDRGYCYNHFNYCNSRGCDARARHTLADGRRACHKHVRNQKGALSDKQLRKTIVEVR